jgi:hypothetical protein
LTISIHFDIIHKVAIIFIQSENFGGIMRIKFLSGLIFIVTMFFMSCRNGGETYGERENVGKDYEIPRGVEYPTEPGSYRLDDWEYSYEIKAKGSRSERRIGVLKCKGVEVKGSLGDIKDTPFGKFMHFSSDPHEWNIGWLNTRTYDRRVFDEDGKLLSEVRDMLGK